MNRFNSILIIGAAIAIAQWPDGSITRDPATDLQACFAAAEAWTQGRGLPLNRYYPALHVWCQSTSSAKDAGFERGWDCIQGHNCQ